MKSLSLSLNRVLLLTSMLFAPSLAMAQAPATNAENQDVQQSTAMQEEGVAPETQEAAPPEVEASVDEAGEVVVLGRFIPEPMRQTSEVATFLSTEDLSRQGDDTAALALTRLTGLSVVSGRFVFVRGLGDRYSSALLNGSPLPSPEPLRRTVPLDLFPSNILDGATVQKTYSPNYPGEFGGGVIDLRTLSQPSEPFFTMKVGGGVNPETTARRGLIYHGGDYDWLGYDDGLRDVPGPLMQAIAVGDRISDANFDVGTLETIGESFVNSPLSVIQSQDIAPDFEAEVSGGVSIDAGQFNIGLVGVAGYDSSWRTQRAARGLVAGTPATIEEQGESLTTNWDITVNALGGVSLGWGENEIQATLLYVHASSKEAQFSTGFEFGAIGAVPCVELGACEFNRFTESTAWYERELASLQISGEHRLGRWQFDWRGAAAQSTRDAPYERSLGRQIGADGAPFYARSNDYSIRFSELTDEIISGGADISYTLPITEQRDAVFSAGYAYSHTVRDYQRLDFVFGGSLNLALPSELEIARQRADFLFGPDNIHPQRFEIIELTGDDDAYKGGLLVNAAYVSADVELLPLLRAAVGVRWEDGRQSVRTLNRFGALPADPVQIENEYYLPAATLTWNFAEDLQFRLGYSKTIARPQFRELAFSPYFDPDTDRIYRGNPSLVDSELTNYDARLEYYFGRNQFVTLGGFYKEITSPIEEVLVLTSGGNFETNFINAPKATLYGGEVEYRTSFESPFEEGWLADKTWLFSINYTYTSSEVQAGEGDIVIDPSDLQPRPATNFALDGSPLQGTPEHILNAQFGFETDASQLTLLVGWVDERILRRGFGAGLADVIEHPGINVDLVFRHDFTYGGRAFTLGLSGRNLLEQEHEEFQQTELGAIDVNTYQRGRSFSASLSAKF
jgi:outer membrane receptor protein involved in Fe transport